jgi:hypothetical protein
MAAINLVVQRSACNCKRIDWRRANIILDETLETFASQFQRSGSFPFVQLPIELRTMVYAYHFNQPPIKIYSTEWCPAGNLCPNNIFNANIPVGEIILASKTVYSEAMPMYFRTKDFIFWTSRSMSGFINRAGPFQRDYITSLAFGMDYYNDVIDTLEICRLAVQCTSLRKLSIMAYKAYAHPPRHPRLGRINKITESELFKTLSLSRNTASVEIDAEAEVATLLFVPSTERSFVHEIPSARGRTLISRTVATPEPLPQSPRTDFSPVTHAGTQALTVDPKRDILQNREQLWRRGTIAYGSTRHIHVPRGDYPGTIPIYNSWS